MKKLLWLLLLVPFVSAAQANNEVKKTAKTVERIVDGEKGQGKPSNPGAKGRANAEIKKATNPGQGGGKNSSLGGELLDELIDDDDQKGGKDKKKKGKKGKKKK
jgi:hypothetical protein